MIEVRVRDPQGIDVRVRVSEHAIHRYKQRVEPGISRDEAVQRIVGQLQGKQMRKKRPAWAGRERNLKHQILTDGYLVVRARETELAFPLTLHRRGLCVTTCLVRQG